MFTAHLKNPPGEVYVFIHKRLENQVMGLAIDSQTGEPIEAVILPTRQRIMLALGVGNEDANIHHKYRRKYRHGYTVTWISDPKTDKRLAKFRGEPTVDAEPASSAKVGATQDTTHRPEQAPVSPPDTMSGDLTASLIKAGIERGTAKDLATRAADKPARDPKVDENKASVGEPAQSKPKEVVDMFGGV